MAYRPDSAGVGLVRDKAYASEIAAQRPMCAPRIHCEDRYDERRENERASIRGDQGYDPYPSSPPDPGPRSGDITEDRVALFNHQLRAGHGFVNENDPHETGHYED
jgi:hypothetical protein